MNVHCPDGVAPLSGLRWFGHKHIVHKQRARKLRKRGVQLQTVAPGVWAWYESYDSYTSRVMRKELKRLLRCAKPIPWTDAPWETIQNTLRNTDFREIEAQLEAHRMQVAVMTGHALDAVCGLRERPPGWTDEMVREYYLYGYIYAPGLGVPHADAILERKSPVLEFYYRYSFPHTITVELS
jgi:hypothetical protein